MNSLWGISLFKIKDSPAGSNMSNHSDWAKCKPILNYSIEVTFYAYIIPGTHLVKLCIGRNILFYLLFIICYSETFMFSHLVEARVHTRA